MWVPPPPGPSSLFIFADSDGYAIVASHDLCSSTSHLVQLTPFAQLAGQAFLDNFYGK